MVLSITTVVSSMYVVSTVYKGIHDHVISNRSIANYAGLKSLIDVKGFNQDELSKVYNNLYNMVQGVNVTNSIVISIATLQLLNVASSGIMNVMGLGVLSVAVAGLVELDRRKTSHTTPMLDFIVANKKHFVSQEAFLAMFKGIRDNYCTKEAVIEYVKTAKDFGANMIGRVKISVNTSPQAETGSAPSVG
jgi:hypothetical protein